MIWKTKPQLPEEKISHLQSQLPSLSSDAIRLLLHRGIEDFEAAKHFFNPNTEQIHNPFLMKNMDLAVEILTDIYSSGHKILLYGDYDVDGTCSVALAHSFLKTMGANTEYYIPDRYSEGYGVSDQSVQYAIESEVKLVITMDCGIRAIQQIEDLKKAGISVIVCDHHEPGENLPIADAVLDPKQKDCAYPFKELCGCGVAFKLFQGFCIQQGIPEEQLFQFVDILALATCADIVPMVDENRVFVRLGLEKVNSNPSLGLAILKKKSGFENDMNVRSLVFGFAPRINAAGRISHAKGAVELMIAEDAKRAEELADEVEKYNQERRVLDKSITEDALQQILEKEDLKDRKTTVLADANWHKGVIGIVASRCIETYHRPTIILTEVEGMMTGSARSVGEFDILQALTKCEHLLGKYGGHRFAAGLSMIKENFTSFCETFESIVASSITSKDLEPFISIEQELPLERINFVFYKLLERMEPFGPKNMQPIFMTSNLRLENDAVLLKEEHVKFSLKSSIATIDCIGFGRKDSLALLNSGEAFDIAYTIEINEYKNVKKLQLMIRDIRKTELVVNQ